LVAKTGENQSEKLPPFHPRLIETRGKTLDSTLKDHLRDLAINSRRYWQLTLKLQ